MLHSSLIRFLIRAAAGSLLTLSIAAAAQAQTESILHDFVPLPDGTSPSGQLAQDSTGNLYGSAEGGFYGNGVVYELSPTKNGTWTQKVLHNFAGGSDGWGSGEVSLDSAGNVYGITNGEGTTYCGTLYKLSPSATGVWTENIIHEFCSSPTDASTPAGPIIIDAAGNIYGTSIGGGANGGGTVYRFSPTAGGAWTEDILYSFTFRGAGGSTPGSRLLLDSSGNIYGTTSLGGNLDCNNGGYGPQDGCGVVFQLTPASDGTWTENVLYTFAATNSLIEYPQTGLLMDSAGNLYGVQGDNVTLFQLQPSAQGQWTFNVLSSSNSIEGELAMDSSGNLYGETPGVNNCVSAQCGSVFELQNTGTGWNFTTLYTFPVISTESTYPTGGVTLDASGNIFGATLRSNDLHFTGSIFELTKPSSGTFQRSVLYQFPQVDGAAPSGDLIADSAGNLYGVTSSGGTNSLCDCGIVFRLSPIPDGGWHYAILFDPGASSFFNPLKNDQLCLTGGLTFDSFGNLYGVSQCSGSGGGAVYKLTPTTTGPWQLTKIYTFGQVPIDASEPRAALTVDAQGNLYGTTIDGGFYGEGTVFELSPRSDGTYQYFQLYAFGSASRLTLDSSGNLYGTIAAGGYGYGSVFKLARNAGGLWTGTTLYAFPGGYSGIYPTAGVTFGPDGNLYGSTSDGGSGSAGTVFVLSPSASGLWYESTIYNFQGGLNDGKTPTSDLTFDAEGNLYGTTYYGGLEGCGTQGCGTLFKLTPSGGGAWNENIVYFFGGNTNGGVYPASGVVLNSSGALFGTTSAGPGIYGNLYSGGTVYEITP
jgi:uncharacterized repeat protein (TIGR03803 family)